MENLEEEKLATLQQYPKFFQLRDLTKTTEQGEVSVNVIEEVSGRWQDLARCLEFKAREIQKIEKDYKYVDDACRAILDMWHQGYPNTREPVTWKTLIHTLCDAGFEDVADRLLKILL